MTERQFFSTALFSFSEIQIKEQSEPEQNPSFFSTDLLKVSFLISHERDEMLLSTAMCGDILQKFGQVFLAPFRHLSQLSPLSGISQPKKFPAQFILDAAEEN